MRAAHRMLQAIAVLLTIAVMAAPGCTGKKAPASPPVDPNKLVIVKAVWGDFRGIATADVTQAIKGMVKDNALRVEADAGIFGDPAIGKLKYLRLEWSKGGVVARRRALEGETIAIRADERPAPVRLEIRKAVYGNLAGGKTEDVTDMVAAMVVANTLTVTPSNATFGDPAEGQFKQLRVDYTFDGVAKSKTVDEKQPLSISGTGQ
jgi:hypothetical protein